MTKEYKINLALTDSDISEIKNVGMKLHFLPTDDVEYKEKITISLNHAEEDASLSDCMNLNVDTWRDSK